LEQLTGHPVRTTYRGPGGRSLPNADAVIVEPATYNTINKWAAGIADNYVLNQLAELTGLGVRIVVLPFINQAMAANQPPTEARRLKRDSLIWKDQAPSAYPTLR
jgi:phosphopantothenoylcysteine synthetase/decarboxylase